MTRAQGSRGYPQVVEHKAVGVTHKLLKDIDDAYVALHDLIGYVVMPTRTVEVVGCHALQMELSRAHASSVHITQWTTGRARLSKLDLRDWYDTKTKGFKPLINDVKRHEYDGRDGDDVCISLTRYATPEAEARNDHVDMWMTYSKPEVWEDGYTE